MSLTRTMMQQFDWTSLTYSRYKDEEGKDPYQATVRMWGIHSATEWGKTPEEALRRAVKRFNEESGDE